MHANRPTADCIWNSFQSSGKRHLILTGSKASGKSTLLGQLFPKTQPGITTWVQPQSAVFLKENHSGESAQVGIFDSSLPGPGNQMRPLPEGFSHLGVPSLRRCIDSPAAWITIDEIGYLENQFPNYQHALRELFACKHVAAVIRKQSLPFLQELCTRGDVFLVDLDRPYGSIGCVIMASGLGKRFGSNKLMADFHAQPMITRILDATEGIFTQRIVVTRHAEIAQLCRSRSIDVILHDLPFRNDTVRLGLDALHSADRCMFCPADQPLLRRDTIAALALASANAPCEIWRTACNGLPGSPVVFPAWAFDGLRSLPQGKGGGVIIKKTPERLRLVNVRDAYELKDVDSPEDLSALLEQ